MDALRRFGCLRLGARIWDLKNQGHQISMELIEVNKKRVARYSLVSSARSQANDTQHRSITL
jgi:hypothetical protein